MIRHFLTLAALLVPAAAHAERFAIVCDGLATWRMSQSGRDLPRDPPTRTRQIYVIDEEAQTARRVLIGLRELDDDCAPSMRCSRTFSADRIRIEHVSVDPDLSFRSRLELDRRSWRADYHMEIDYPEMRMESDWAMTCERGEIPAFARGR